MHHVRLVAEQKSDHLSYIPRAKRFSMGITSSPQPSKAVLIGRVDAGGQNASMGSAP